LCSILAFTSSFAEEVQVDASTSFSFLGKDTVAFLDWFRVNGGYLHSSLVLRDGGVFADNGDVGKGDILFQVPRRLRWHVCLKEDSTEVCELRFAEALLSYRCGDDHATYAPFLDLLPHSCTSPVCWAADYSLYSKSFRDYVDASKPPGADVIALSVIRSYWFGKEYGLIPGASSFNHDGVKGSMIAKIVYEDKPDEDVIGAIAAVDYAQGEEVFLSYFDRDDSTGEIVPKGSAQMYYLFGFVEQQPVFDSCYDFVHYRHPMHDREERLRCLAEIGSGAANDASEKEAVVGQMLEEMQVAISVGDWDYVKGFARAIDNYVA